MKILFIDDEQRILEGIERMLFHLTDEWEMEFANGGEEGLEELAEGDFDVVVTDMRMPGMDGAQVLREVNKRYPDIVRIVLSGYAELEAALRTVPVAHQFLIKPCRADLLQDTILRACSLQELLSDETIRKVAGGIEKLPSVPSIYNQLTRALADLETDAKDVAEIIKHDPAMSAKVLQLVNSAFFARSSNVSDIKQAVVRLGFQMVKNLALSIEVFQPQELALSPDRFSIESSQEHAFRTATTASKMFKEKQKVDDAFMAGMLHDIGILLLATELPERLDEALTLAESANLELHEAEYRLFGTTHAEIGAYLLSLWGLPYPIIEAVANHHAPTRVTREGGFDVLSAVYLANHLDQGLPVDVGYLDDLGITGQFDAWQLEANQLRESLQKEVS